MAAETKRPDVFNPTLAAAFNDRDNVVGSPGAQMRSKPRELLSEYIERAIAIRIPHNRIRPFPALQLGLSHQRPENPLDLVAIHATAGADSLVTLKHLLTKVAGGRTQFMLVDALIRAEGTAAFRHLLATAHPSAQRSAVWPLRQFLWIYPSGRNNVTVGAQLLCPLVVPNVLYSEGTSMPKRRHSDRTSR